MITEQVIFEIKDVCICLGFDSTGWFVYVRPVNKTIQELYAECLEKHKVKQSQKKYFNRTLSTPSIEVMSENKASIKFFRLCKQAQLPQISFE